VWEDILRQQGNRVLFIQYQTKKQCQLWVLEGNERKLLTSPPESVVDITKTVLKGMTPVRKFDICICDGVWSNDHFCDALLGVLDSASGEQMGAVISKLVLVSSFQFNVANGDEMTISTSYVTKLSFDSWILPDYEMAAKSAVVKSKLVRAHLLSDWKGSPKTGLTMDDEQRILEVVTWKFHFAGGSARYMFEMNMEQLLQELADRCTRVREWSAFAETRMNYNTLESVNALMQSFSN
jgi:hypothetical protein